MRLPIRNFDTAFGSRKAKPNRWPMSNRSGAGGLGGGGGGGPCCSSVVATGWSSVIVFLPGTPGSSPFPESS